MGKKSPTAGDEPLRTASLATGGGRKGKTTVRYRTPMIAGAVGTGALALILVGPGSFASFTSSVTTTQTIKTGTFQLEAKGGTPTVSGSYDANTIGQPQLSATNGAVPQPPNFNGNTVSFGLGNIAPGDTYTEPVTVYDVGSLQGQIDTVTYTPASGTNAVLLEKAMNVTVQVKVGGTWTDVHSSDGSGAPGQPVSAASPHTFYLDYSFGPQFLQPNPKLYDYAQASAAGFSINELSTSLRIVFSLPDTTSSQNAVEGLSAAPTLSFNGVHTP